jgi:hypothetical protein
MFLSSGDKKSYIFCVIYFVRTIAPGELGGSIGEIQKL